MECRVAFAGAGSFAHSHAYALSALPHHYPDAPRIACVSVTSGSEARRNEFARRHGFACALDTDRFFAQEDVDTVFVLGPNRLHHAHLVRSLAMPNVRRVYVEKPLCVTREEEDDLESRLASLGPITVQVGYQLLQMGAIRRALEIWRSGDLGEPIHVQARLLHGGYLDESYRASRAPRMAPAPEGGALSDLGCHVLSLLVAFLGNGLEVVAARLAGRFPDVPAGSDLCTHLMLVDRSTGAAGTVVASRVSAGSGDLLEIELWATRGSLRVSTRNPDVVEVGHGEHSARWTSYFCGGDFKPASFFPAAYTASGWLRSLVHAHYLFLGGQDPRACVPDLAHSLVVQRLVRRGVELFGAC